MNCDRIAPFYLAIESISFGLRLQKRRLAFLHAAKGKRRALILGDGNGRFLEALNQVYPHLEIDSIDNSRNMLAQASKRVKRSIGHSVIPRLIHADARTFFAPAAHYDIVFTHFFLDCFQPEELHALIRHIAGMLTTDATWIISDFRLASHGWRRFYTGLLLRTMYRFFRMATGLEARHLPDHSTSLLSTGFRLTAHQITADGLIASEYWQR